MVHNCIKSIFGISLGNLQNVATHLFRIFVESLLGSEFDQGYLIHCQNTIQTMFQHHCAVRGNSTLNTLAYTVKQYIYITIFSLPFLMEQNSNFYFLNT